MDKLCPFRNGISDCNSECALRIDDDCAFTHIAKSFRQREILREAWSKIANMRYGTLSSNYVDTDSVKLNKENENENTGNNV